MSSAGQKDQEEHPLQAQVIDPLVEFSKDSFRLLNKCHKPDLKEFRQVAFATGVGLLVLGFLGFFVKLIHIPINDILVGSG